MNDMIYDFDHGNRYEIIGGIKIMSPSGTIEHNTIIGNLYRIFANYLREHKNGRVFTDSLDVHFNNGELYMPDLKVVCDLSILKPRSTIYGVPDLVAEVLSRSTRRFDRGKKKDTYESSGVREYWIIEPIEKSIEVYHLIDGKYELDDVYQIYSENEWNQLTEEERTQARFEIKVSLFDDLIVDVNEVFEWID
ncbi:MAG: Uma2 family endonuclease [Selenomonadaceae bacterium]|nr:Uma2 family endonuclease [Selenomonadaceae bacterium]